MAAVARSAARGATAAPGRLAGGEVASPVAASAPPQGGAARPARATAARRSSLRSARRRGAASRPRGRVVVAPAVVDGLLRERLWVALIAVLLTGIVFLNVALLDLNGVIARTDARVSELRDENAVLRLRVARLASSERIRRAAEARGFVAARPGQVGYLRPHDADPERAARALERWHSSSPAAGPVGSATP
jgi:hypothetical protein